MNKLNIIPETIKDLLDKKYLEHGNNLSSKIIFITLLDLAQKSNKTDFEWAKADDHQFIMTIYVILKQFNGFIPSIKVTDKNNFSNDQNELSISKDFANQLNNLINQNKIGSGYSISSLGYENNLKSEIIDLAFLYCFQSM